MVVELISVLLDYFCQVKMDNSWLEKIAAGSILNFRLMN